MQKMFPIFFICAKRNVKGLKDMNFVRNSSLKMNHIVQWLCTSSLQLLLDVLGLVHDPFSEASPTPKWQVYEHHQPNHHPTPGLSILSTVSIHCVHVVLVPRSHQIRARDDSVCIPSREFTWIYLRSHSAAPRIYYDKAHSSGKLLMHGDSISKETVAFPTPQVWHML